MEYLTLNKLYRNKDIPIGHQDKSNTAVIIKTTDYIEKMESIRQDNVYKLAKRGPIIHMNIKNSAIEAKNQKHAYRKVNHMPQPASSISHLTHGECHQFSEATIKKTAELNKRL